MWALVAFLGLHVGAQSSKPVGDPVSAFADPAVETRSLQVLDEMAASLRLPFAVGCPAMLLSIFVGCALLKRKIYTTGVEHGKQAQADLPKGIVLSPEELAAQLRLQAVGSRNLLDLAAVKKDPGSERLICNCREVVAPKAKVYVYGPSDDEQSYVICEVRGCTAGPPLLPDKNEDGTYRWTAPGDPYIHFAMYLAMAMTRLTGRDWSMRVLPYLNGSYVVRYQAVLREEDWREVWDTLLKPFTQQRTVYRRFRKSARAPDIFFGVKAKLCEPGDLEDVDPANYAPSLTNTGTEEGGEGVTTPDMSSSADGSEQTSSVGVGLPRAAVWLDYWQNAEIPQYNTFVDFATEVDEKGFPRSNSMPDVLGRHSDDGLTSTSSGTSTGTSGGTSTTPNVREILHL